MGITVLLGLANVARFSIISIVLLTVLAERFPDLHRHGVFLEQLQRFVNSRRGGPADRLARERHVNAFIAHASMSSAALGLNASGQLLTTLNVSQVRKWADKLPMVMSP